MLPLLRPAALCLLAAAFLVAPAQAQEAGEPPPGAAESIKFNDRERLVEVALPKNWKAEKHATEQGQLAYWQGPFQRGANAGVLVSTVRGARRPEMARASFLALGSEQVADSLRAGDGWAEGAMLDPQAPLGRFARFVKTDGQMLSVEFRIHKNVLADLTDEVVPFARAILDSFRVVGEIEGFDAPEGWSSKKIKPYLVQTDAEDSDEGAAYAIVKDLTDLGKVFKKVLPGDPYVDGPPVVRVYKIPATYESDATKAVGEAPDHATYDPGSGALLIKLNAKRIQGFDWALRQAAATQRVALHFGGSPPFWASSGLRMYGLCGMQSGGKPAKPDKKFVSDAKGAIVSASKRLDEYFGKRNTDFPDNEATQRRLWGWTQFLIHAKQGGKYRKTYQAYLQSLRDSGDPLAAAKVWDGTDFDAMFEAFQKWGKSLK